MSQKILASLVRTVQFSHDNVMECWVWQKLGDEGFKHKVRGEINGYFQYFASIAITRE